MRNTNKILLLTLAGLAAAKDHDWKTGKVLDSQSAKQYVDSGAVTTVNGDVARTAISQASIRNTDLLIVTDDYLYVVEDARAGLGSLTAHGAIIQAIGNRHHGCRFIVGETAKFWQEKNALHAVDADGKECKMEIVRQERLAR